MSKPLKDLKLSPKVIEALHKAKLNYASQVVLLTVNDIIRKVEISQVEAKYLLTEVSKIFMPRCLESALNLNDGITSKFYNVAKLTTGCSILDKLLDGGISNVGITEIVGESASGKTQFCLQLSSTCQLPVYLGGLHKATAYISTEGPFPSQRLSEISKKFVVRFGDEVKDINFMDNVYVSKIESLESFMTCIAEQLPQLVASKNIGLIVVDSIAAIVRSEFDHSDYFSKSQTLQKIGFYLKKLVDNHRVIVCCVNQVSANIKEEHQPGLSIGHSSTIPSLGLSWSNIISTRLMISRTNKCVQIGRRFLDFEKKTALPVYAAVRDIGICFSPYLNNQKSQFIVNFNGVQGNKE